jgi:hypothetical protein
MQPGESYDVIGIHAITDEVNAFFRKYNEKLAVKGLRARSIFNEEAQQIAARGEHNYPVGEMKYLPRSMLTPSAMTIFKTKTIIFPYTKKGDPRVIVIQGKDVADSFRAQFNLIWNQQAIVMTGLEGPRKVILDILKSDGNNVSMGIQEKQQFRERIPETMEYFFEEYKKRKLKGRVLIKLGDSLRFTIKGKKTHIGGFGEEFRYLPDEFFSPLVIEVYGSTVALIDWTEPVTTIFIEKKEIAEGFIKYFDVLWKIAKP